VPVSCAQTRFRAKKRAHRSGARHNQLVHLTSAIFKESITVMTDWAQAPVFGTARGILPHVVRPSAYVIVTNADGHLAIVRTPRGNYLPGGGQEPGESPTTTAVREAREECGLHIRVSPWRTCAIEHVDVPDEGAHFEKRSIFCEGVLISHTALPHEADHALSWLALPDAVASLSPLSHRWAVTEWRAGSRGDGYRETAV